MTYVSEEQSIVIDCILKLVGVKNLTVRFYLQSVSALESAGTLHSNTLHLIYQRRTLCVSFVVDSYITQCLLLIIVSFQSIHRLYSEVLKTKRHVFLTKLLFWDYLDVIVPNFHDSNDWSETRPTTSKCHHKNHFPGDHYRRNLLNWIIMKDMDCSSKLV